jgi:hypothetical protein
VITLLNTSILTAYGTYEYTPLSLKTAQHVICEGYQSAIGHEATAQILTELLGVPVAMNRIVYEQAVGDEALVFKLRGRPPEGAILTREQIESIGYDFGLLYRAA